MGRRRGVCRVFRGASPTAIIHRPFGTKIQDHSFIRKLMADYLNILAPKIFLPKFEFNP